MPKYFLYTHFKAFTSKRILKTASIEESAFFSINNILHSQNRFSSTNLQIRNFFEEKAAALRNHERSLLDESQRILNDGVCAHELVMEKIRRLRAIIEDNSIGTHDNLVQVFLNLHKEISIVFEEISHWGEVIILFDQRNVKIEVINALNRGDSPIGASSSYEMRKTCSLQHGPLNTEDAVFAFYKNHTFKPKLVWNKCHRPAGIGLAPWGNEITEQQLLYVAGTESKVVFVVNRTHGKIVQRICHDEMAYPNGICFDPDREEIFISDKWKHCIFVFSAKGTFLRRLCDKGEQEGYLRSPEGLAVGPNDSLFVCDAGNDRVQCINSITGRMLSQFGRILKDQLLRAIHTKTPTRHVDLKCPTSVAVHKDTVIILDSGNRRVKAFNKRGEQILEFGQTGSLTGQFQYPEVIAVDSAGFTLVGDGGSAKVLVYGPGGQFVTAFGSRGDSPGKFNWLSGLYVSKDREIIISDYKNHSVQIIS